MTKENKYSRELFKCYCWRFSNTNCFSDMLFDLIAKADFENKALIRQSFPDHVAAFDEWVEKGDRWLREEMGR